MTQMEHQIRRVQRRLWLDRWFHDVTFCVALAAGAYAGVVLIQRLYDLPIPLPLVAGGMLGVALVGAGVWTYIKREGAAYAAARLDEAAGFRERISSGRYCQAVDDPFAQAVVTDAERVSASVSVRRHIRLTVPRPLGWAGGAVGLAALMFLIAPGMLKDDAAVAVGVDSASIRETKVAVKRTLESVQELVERTPVLKDLEEAAAGLDKEPVGRLNANPTSIRHEAVKKIDKLSDAAKRQRGDPKYTMPNELRKMLRGLKTPKESNTMTKKLTKSLAQGDFKTAREEIKAIREQLATLKLDQDKEMVEKLSKQLNDLAKQLEQLSKDKKLAQQLQQAGIKKEDLERMLENLKKKDLDAIKKQLAEKGYSQRDIEKIAKQLQQKQQAGSKAKQLSQSMKQAGQCNNPGQMGEAMGGLSAAAEMLSELESLEQEMNQLDAAMAELQDAKNDLDSKCSQCRGTGEVSGQPCGKCGGNGSGRGMSKKLGQGAGGLAPEEQTSVGFKIHKQKVHTGKGAITGQFLVDGEQVKGDVASKLVDVVSAAERNASDLINRDRIPRQYQKAVKEYFSNVQRAAKPKEGKDAPAADKKQADPKQTDAKDPDTKGDG